MSWIEALILLSLTTYRITRLITRDTFPPVAAIRKRVIGDDGIKLEKTRWEWFGELIGCYWCAAVWVSGVLVIASMLFVPHGIAMPLFIWPAAAAVGALIEYREGE